MNDGTGGDAAAGYDERFYGWQAAGSYRSAQRVLSWLFARYRPQSLLDVGCGIGTWLKAAAQLGVSDLEGIEGTWSDAQPLLVEGERIHRCDLEQGFDRGRRFDLVISLEVAEHLAPQRAEAFVRNLTAHADLVLFSAAPPHQGGIHHVNEQWPAYWQRLFKACGYAASDVLRTTLWQDPEIEWWYRQNAVLYAQPGHPLWQQMQPCEHLLPLVHPDKYIEMAELLADPARASLRQTLQHLPRQVARVLRHRLRRRP